MNISRSWSRALAITILASAPCGAALAEARPAEAAPALVDASIPFGLIRDWHADGDRGLWVQSNSRRWYYARFMGTCTGLNFATSLGFDTRFQSSFDRWSSVLVPGYGPCVIQTFSTSDGPPPKKRKGSAEPAQTAG